jgi:hypothetical protein
MLKDKKVLCVGNANDKIDKIVSILASKNKSANKGLLTNHLQIIKENGFYHTSLADIDIYDFENFVKQFDHVIYFKQSLDEYDNEELYYTTRHAIIFVQNRLTIPLEIKDISNAKKR